MTRSTALTAQSADSSLLHDEVGSNSQRFLIPSEENQQIATEVNEYLSRAIDARNVERLKNENINSLTLKFRDSELERKVSSFLQEKKYFFSVSNIKNTMHKSISVYVILYGVYMSLLRSG